MPIPPFQEPEVKSHLHRCDPVLARIIDTLPDPVLSSTGDVFFDLMSCVLEQQIHYRSTKRTFQKLLAQAELTTLNPDNFARFDHRALAHHKLSMTKQATITHILTTWEGGPPDWALLSDTDVRRYLSAIPGIGQWTIDMILLYTLQRPNVFPVDDFHLRQVMTFLYGLNPARRLTHQMRAIAEHWAGKSSLAVRYLLAWKESRKKQANVTVRKNQALPTYPSIAAPFPAGFSTG